MKGKPYLALVFSMIFWSFSFVWFKIANIDYDPVAIIFIRLCIAIVFLTGFLWITRRFTPVKKGDRKYFLLLALFEPFFYFLGESFGLTYVSSTVGSVIISTIPVFAVIFAWVIYRERLKPVNYAGVIISFIGVLIFITNSTGSITLNPNGLALMFLAVVSAVGYNMVLHKLAYDYDPVTIVNIQNIIGAILFLPLFIFLDLQDFISTGIIAKSFGSIVLLAIFASCGAFVLFAYSVRHVGIARANIFSNLIPVFTAIFAFLIVGDRLTVRNGVGMAVVIAGLFLSQAGKKGQAVVDTDFAGRSA
ncbi:MAG: DMT family transporter [Bacteroidales bacterium]|jgi:drug/metabolite transporter (DMT)-like permease|nr:DMT family transporter [Bacteroidales bacterium]